MGGRLQHGGFSNGSAFLFLYGYSFVILKMLFSTRSASSIDDEVSLSLSLQDFLGQAHFTLGEVVGSLGSRSEKALG